MVDDLIRLISSPHFWWLVKIFAAVWVFLAVADSLPHPAETRPWWIKVPYAVVQAMAGNLRRAFSAARALHGGN